jgi:hypothetical protein
VRQSDLDAVRDQVTASADALGFVPLDGRVAVSIALHPPVVGARQQPEMPKVVKAYLDAMERIAYRNDGQVDYLEVHQSPMRHPMMDGYVPRDEDRDSAAVFIEVEPQEDYSARYDRAVAAGWLKRDAPWWPAWSISDEAELSTLRRRLRYATGTSQEPLRALVRAYEERKLTDGVLADIDRPGQLPGPAQLVHRALPIQRFLRWTRRRSGATFWIPLRGSHPGSSSTWRRELEGELEAFARRSVGLPLSGFVALDIAVRGTSVEGKDLDNLAHSILIPFEEKLCVRRGTVSAYRVYVAPGEPDGVQVRVLDSGRLQALDIALRELRGKPTADERIRLWGERMKAQLESEGDDRRRGESSA